MKATELCQSPVEIDIYGPVLSDVDVSLLTSERARYMGQVDPSDVPALLNNYDFLLLPTFWPNEGYPGVIIESFLAGMPVITTRIGGIPEIVNETCGIFVEPESEVQLACAIDDVCRNPARYRELCDGAAKQGELFHSGKWTNAFIELCRDAVCQKT